MEKYEIFKKVIDNFKNNENVIGILLVGKVKDTPINMFSKLNDIDLFIIDNSKVFKREVVNINGVIFDISYLSLKIIESIVKNKIPLMINILYNAKLYYCKFDGLDKLLKKINNIYLKGPKPIDKNEENYIRFKLYDLFKDANNRKYDDVLCNFILNELLDFSLESYFKLNNKWIPKKKNMLNYIKINNIKLFNLILEFINCYDIEKKLDISREVIEYISEPFGGLLVELNKCEFPIYK